MELWIRSQDKKMLTKLDYIYLEPNNGLELQGGNHYMINKSLGTYATKERALEVLDEIQKLLMPISEYKQEIDNLTINYKNIDTIVYEMPKE